MIKKGKIFIIVSFFSFSVHMATISSINSEPVVNTETDDESNPLSGINGYNADLRSDSEKNTIKSKEFEFEKSEQEDEPNSDCANHVKYNKVVHSNKGICQIAKKYPKQCVVVAGAIAAAAFYFCPEFSKGESQPAKYCQNYNEKALREIVGNLIILRTIDSVSADNIREYEGIFTEPVRRALDLENDYSVNCFVKRCLVGHSNGSRLVYCIFDKTSSRVIGAIELRRSGYCGNLGYWIHDHFWGGGYIQEAIGLVVRQHFFLNPEINFFTAHVANENIRSYNALRKFGFENFDEEQRNITDQNDYFVQFTRQKFENKQWHFVQKLIISQRSNKLELRWVWE